LRSGVEICGWVMPEARAASDYDGQRRKVRAAAGAWPSSASTAARSLARWPGSRVAHRCSSFTTMSDAGALVAALTDAELDEQSQQAVALLAPVAGQDVEPAEGSDGTDGRWRIACRVAEDQVISTVDSDARHTRKSPEARRDGYRAHTAAEPGTGIITDEELTKASGADNADPAVAKRFLADDIATSQQRVSSAEGHSSHDELTGGHPPVRRHWYGDSAYGTDELRGAIHDAGHEAVIKPSHCGRRSRAGSP
jgi:hypothetical protein